MSAPIDVSSREIEPELETGTLVFGGGRVGSSPWPGTRASLPVKRRFSGDWTVRVFSLDGVELATKKFRIDAPRRSRSAR